MSGGPMSCGLKSGGLKSYDQAGSVGDLTWTIH